MRIIEVHQGCPDCCWGYVGAVTAEEHGGARTALASRGQGGAELRSEVSVFQ